jgi:hypothetical protein
MQYFLLLLFTLISFFFLICRFLGEFFLPSSNNLPHTYREMCAIMKYIIMEYHTIDEFVNDHIIHYGK